MAGNIALDFGHGAIPLAGDIFDLFFKSSARNVRLLIDNLEGGKSPRL
jgi:hypothetical protein